MHNAHERWGIISVSDCLWLHTQPVDIPRAPAVTCTADMAMLGPLTHCTGPGIKPAPLQQPEPRQVDSKPSAPQWELLE